MAANNCVKYHCKMLKYLLQHPSFRRCLILDTSLYCAFTRQGSTVDVYLSKPPYRLDVGILFDPTIYYCTLSYLLHCEPIHIVSLYLYNGSKVLFYSTPKAEGGSEAAC